MAMHGLQALHLVVKAKRLATLCCCYMTFKVSQGVKVAMWKISMFARACQSPEAFHVLSPNLRASSHQEAGPAAMRLETAGLGLTWMGS